MKETEFSSEKKIVLRPMSTLSLLPHRSILNPDASLLVDEKLTFTATRVAPEKEYYELAWAYHEEIAFSSSITIGAEPFAAKVILFPARWPAYIEDEGQDLSDAKVLREAGKILASQIVDGGRLSDLISLEESPALINSNRYSIDPGVQLSLDYQAFLFQQVSVANNLMVRGLSHLLKSAMLSRFSRTFVDTACLEIYVALEATLQIILEKLRDGGAANPSNRDASDFLLEAFGETYRLEKYYESYYEDRIKAVHPNSRFGIAKFTPLYVDDLYMLYNDLLRNFEFIITGQPNCYEKYQENLL